MSKTSTAIELQNYYISDKLWNGIWGHSMIMSEYKDKYKA